jgi:MFS family permease
MARKQIGVDTRPIRRSPGYRALFFSTIASVLSGQIATFGVVVTIWVETGSPVLIGAIGLAKGIPIILFALAGGALADKADRRTIVVLSTIANSIVLVGLAAVVHAGMSISLIYALVFMQASVSAFGSPARRALVSGLLPGGLVGAGFALLALVFQMGLLLGPALSGMLAAYWSDTITLLIASTLSLCASVVAARIPRSSAEPAAPSCEQTDVRKTLDRTRESVAGFLRGNRQVRSAMLLDIFTTLFAMPVALFPLLNDERFDGSSITLGYFYSTLALGAVSASLLSGLYTASSERLRIQFIASAAWVGAVLLMALLGNPIATLVAVAIVGACDTIAATSRSALVQLATPDRMRGKVSAVDHCVGVACPEVGNIRAGFVAQLTSAPASLVIGGLAAALALIGLAPTVFKRSQDLTGKGQSPIKDEVDQEENPDLSTTPHQD